MKPLIVGFGQDGRLMAEELMSSSVPFLVVIRRSSTSVQASQTSDVPASKFVSCSVLNAEFLEELYQKFEYTHIFNFAANSFVQDSGDQFRQYIELNSGITWELIKFAKRHPEVWMLQPISCEILSSTPSGYAELGRFISPRNAYGLSKLVDLHSCEIERSVAGVKILTPILFNHESKHRPAQFFTRKVINYLHQKPENRGELKIANCKSVRDWGSAAEYMSILLGAAQQQLSGTALLGTGCGLTVEQFVDHSLAALGSPFEKKIVDGLIEWQGRDIKIRETQRSVEDARRIVTANVEMVIAKFGKAPMIFGSELVRRLVLDEL